MTIKNGPTIYPHGRIKGWLLDHCWFECFEMGPPYGAPNWLRVPIWNWLTGAKIDWRTMKPVTRAVDAK